MTIFNFLNQTAFFMGTILVAVSCLIYSLAGHHTDRPQNNVFLISLLCLIVTAMCNIVCAAAASFPIPSRIARLMMETGNYIFFILHVMQSYLLLYYALFATRSFQRVRALAHVAYALPLAITEVVILTNPLTHYVWHIDEQIRFVRGTGEIMVYITAAIYFTFCSVLFLRHWSGVTRRKRLILIYSLLISVTGIIVQFLYAAAEAELLFEAMGFMGIMLALEYDEDRLDTGTGVYNRTALLQDMTAYFENGREFYAICLRIANMETLQRVIGASDSELIFKMISDYLVSVHPRYMIYRVHTTAFVLLNLKGNEGQVRFLAQMIAWKLEEGWEYQGRRLPMSGVLMYAGIPGELHSPEDIMLLCESPLKNYENGAILAGNDLRAILNRANLETALHRGLTEHNFRVFYQPVYDPSGEKICSAESLIRLNDPEFGELSPGEFIPAAERNGMIEQLGEYTLEEVCDFLESGVPARIGIRYINVNLSVVQCMNPDFVSRVKRIVSHHTVLPSWINFEITETMAAMDYSTLDAVIRELKSEGFMFSMEGYGTGYSNLYSIFSLEFDMIKMDRRLLWDAEKSEDGWTILENSVRLGHELKHEVVLVGVETKEQFENTLPLKVDWYQGNYFSKPLSREALEEMDPQAKQAADGI